MDPSTVCQKLISDPPTRAGVIHLAAIPRLVVGDSALSLAFVQAAARQLPGAGNNLWRDKGFAKNISEICDVRVSLCI